MVVEGRAVAGEPLEGRRRADGPLVAGRARGGGGEETSTVAAGGCTGRDTLGLSGGVGLSQGAVAKVLMYQQWRASHNKVWSIQGYWVLR